MNEELKPCPFCGSEAMFEADGEIGWICCSNKDCPAWDTKIFETTDEAIEAWNRRYIPTCTYEWCEFQPGDPNSYHAWNCSNCGEIDYDFEEPPMYCPYCRAKVVNRYGA